MKTAPIIAEWTDEGTFKPLPRFVKECDANFVVHERYRIETIEERSAKSHSHYFAQLHECWINLREDQTERFPTVDHFRKWCLIKSGFADSRQFVAASKAEALRLGAFVRPCDEFAIVTVHETVVTVWTAQSQSLRAMGKADFQRSKTAVLDLASSMIGVSPEQIEREGRAA